MLNKAKYFVAGLLLSGLASQAQNARVSGNISGLKDAELKFRYYLGNVRKTEDITVKDGKFEWLAVMPEPQRIMASFPNRTIEFFVESGNISITGNIDSLDKIKIVGSKTQDESLAFTASMNDLATEERQVSKDRKGAAEADQAPFDQKMEELENQKTLRVNQYVATHPKSAFSVYLVGQRTFMGEYGYGMSAYEKLDESAKQTFEGKRIAEKLVVLKRSAIGAQMLDFTQNDTEGKPVKFSAFKGKYVFVDFWASWCHPCREENPNVLQAYNRYKDKNFTVVGVSLDDKAENWKKAIKDDQMPWAQLSDLKGWKNEVSTYYGINGIPSTLLVDPQGKIIAKNLRGEALNKKLAELFN